MVVVAQLVEHWVVVPDVAGSSPVGHPTFTESSLRRALEKINLNKFKNYFLQFNTHKY